MQQRSQCPFDWHGAITFVDLKRRCLHLVAESHVAKLRRKPHKRAAARWEIASEEAVQTILHAFLLQVDTRSV